MRRTFSAGPAAESVDYVHRTSAEYLAARWLADQIRSGLPLGRLRALIGVDNHPASELRGLHAWLAILLPDHSNQLIDADPYGVLSYGDPASLSPSSRLHLLAALGRLADDDPWFRPSGLESISTGSLAQPDMVDAFREVLHSSSAHSTFRAMVLDAIANGKPLPELRDDLAAVVTSTNLTYGERAVALNALLRLGQESEQLIVHIYRHDLGNDHDSLRLRAEIITHLYRTYFTPEDVALLITDLLNAPSGVGIGTLWRVRRELPTQAIPAVLDRLEPVGRNERPNLDRRNVREVADLYEHLILRTLLESDLNPTPSSLLNWLHVLHSLSPNYNGVDSEALHDALRNRSALMKAVVESWFSSLDGDVRSCWLAYHDFGRSLHKVLEAEQILRWIVEYLPHSDTGSQRELFLYELALNLPFNGTPLTQPIFADLYALGQSRDDLRLVLNQMCSMCVPEWRLRDNERNRQDEEADAADRERIRRQFESDIDNIRTGSAIHALAWAAQVYFGLFHDLSESQLPRQRLESIIGEQNTLIALEGFRAILERPGIPTLEEITTTYAQQRIYHWWYALVVGMDERWHLTSELNNLSDDLLKTVLAIEQAYPTFILEGSVMSRTRHEWKAAILEHRPELVRDAYLALVRSALRCVNQSNTSISGLYELLNEDGLAAFKTDITLQLLHDFPDAPLPSLEQLLTSGLSSRPAQAEMQDVARHALTRRDSFSQDHQDIWLAAAYILSPTEFEDEVQRIAAIREDIIWCLRDLTNAERNGSRTLSIDLTLGQLEFLAGLAGGRFPPASYPSGGWSGSRNPWDASDLVRLLINSISARPSHPATETLIRLETDDRLVLYRGHIRHALAAQRTLRRDAEYDRPNWNQTIRALTNGAPVNVSDLHALLVAHLDDLKTRIASTNTDIYISSSGTRIPTAGSPPQNRRRATGMSSSACCGKCSRRLASCSSLKAIW